MESTNDLEVYTIPANVLRSRNLFGFPKRNWIEGGVEALLAGYLLNLIPFVAKVKVISILVICLSILTVNLMGIKNRSITQIVIAFFKHRRIKAVYHLGSVSNYDKHKGIQAGSPEGESAAEKVIRIVKSKASEYAGIVNDEDDTGQG